MPDDTAADPRQIIAELQRQLDQRTVALQEALERETATAEVLQVINLSPGDLAPVFDAMVERAVRLCEADEAAVRTFDGELLHLVAAYGEPQVLERLREFGASRPGGLYDQIARGERVTHIGDIRETDTYRENPVARKRLQLRNVRTWLAVALRKEGALLGVINVHRHEVRPFTDKQVTLLENFAAQAVIAMENARLITETREALEQQTATAEVLGVINSSPGDLAPVFEAMLDKALHLCGAAFGVLWRYEEGLLHAAAIRGATAEYADFLTRAAHEAAPGSAHGRLLAGSDVEHITDVADHEDYHSGKPTPRALVDLGGGRTVLAVPLRKDDTFLGDIMIYRREVHRFSDKQIALLQNFAAQAVIAMENARLITETREALEQQTATAEVLQVINSSPGDLAPVFDATLDKALRLCEAAFGALSTYEGNDLHQVVAMRGVPAAIAELLRRASPFGPETGMGRLVRGERFVHIANAADDDGYRLGNPVRRALVDVGGTRTYLAVPLRKGDLMLGAFTIYRQEVRPFTDKQIALLQNFAAQAVTAMENARLLTETREALEQQTATAEVLGVINSSPGDLKPVFDAMLEKALHLCEASFGMLHTQEGDTAQIVASCNLPASYFEYLTREPLRMGPDTFHGRAIRTRSAIHVADISTAEPYLNRVPLAVAAVELGGIRTMAFIPLLKDDAAIGFFIVFRQEVRPFTDKHIALLQNFAAQAVIAIDNARLLEEIRQRQAELRVTFDNMGDGVAMFDADLRLAAWNRNFEVILDLPDAFVAERPSVETYIRFLAQHGEYGAVDVEAEVSRLTGTLGTQWSVERTRPDGPIIEVRHNPVPGGGFVLIYSDVTERKRAEQAERDARNAAEKALGELKAAQASLIQAEKMASLGQLTAGIAHEIKNPLNFVNNFAGLSVELLQELKETARPAIAGLAEDERADVEEIVGMLTSNLEKIAEHGRRADGIVNSMLEHSRGGSGERREVDLNGLVEEALNLAYHGARAQDQNFNITLERDFDRAITPIELAPQEITRVFLNLFGNGCYAATKRQRNGAGPDFRPALKVATQDLG
jgi:GAF domain-containing protein